MTPRDLARPVLAALLIAGMLTACNEGQEDAPRTAETPPAAKTDELPDMAPPAPVVEEVKPVTVPARAFPVGVAMENGRVVASAATFRTSDKVLAGAPVSGRNAKEAMVFWTDVRTGRSVKTETKPVQGDYMTFEFSSKDGMKPGKYNVEIDLDMQPIGIVDFEVK